MQAAQAFQRGSHADALIAAEAACRRLPGQCIPAMLRAAILEASLPALAARAWYAAWTRDPEFHQLQDELLRVWKQSGAGSSAFELGLAFLPQRCMDGTHDSLIALLFTLDAGPFGACWRDGDHIRGAAFSRLCPTGSMALLFSGESTQTTLNVAMHADESGFSGHFSLPVIVAGVISVAFLPKENALPGPERLLAGSPVVFRYPFPAGKHGDAGEAGSDAADIQVCVVIPVYRGLPQVSACILSVLQSLPENVTRTRLIVIDDASPEPALAAWLDQLAATGAIMLLRNRFNLGFIESVNRGLKQGGAADVLLLNADTAVHGNWIDRLRASLYSDAAVASVTPWSNNGEISSFPAIAESAAFPALSELARIDTLCAELHAAGQLVDMALPSCCGFCMLIRGSALNHVGLLDGAALQRGYGEEVDWCLRARAAGYSHRIAAGVFVAHAGSTSFRSEKVLRVRQNRSVITARYPDYYDEYKHFVCDDPLRAIRDTLRDALQKSGDGWLLRLRGADGMDEDMQRAQLPASLASSTPAVQRIAVWQHRPGQCWTHAILTLARLIASTPASGLRLLVFGSASPGLHHTGVVDVVPSLDDRRASPVDDITLIGLSGCSVVMAEPSVRLPQDVACVRVDDAFDPAQWLTAWIAGHAVFSLPESAGFGTSGSATT